MTVICCLGDCYLSPDAGPCLAAEKRYHFDRSQGDCVAFYYGGCEGNGNNFLHYKDCLALCSKGKDPPRAWLSNVNPDRPRSELSNVNPDRPRSELSNVNPDRPRSGSVM